MMITHKNRTTVLKFQLQYNDHSYEEINIIINNNIMMWSADRKQMTFVVDPNEKGFTTVPHHYQPHSNDYFFFIWPVNETLFSGGCFLHRVTIRN